MTKSITPATSSVRPIAVSISRNCRISRRVGDAGIQGILALSAGNLRFVLWRYCRHPLHGSTRGSRHGDGDRCYRNALNLKQFLRPAQKKRAATLPPFSRFSTANDQFGILSALSSMASALASPASRTASALFSMAFSAVESTPSTAGSIASAVSSIASAVASAESRTASA